MTEGVHPERRLSSGTLPNTDNIGNDCHSEIRPTTVVGPIALLKQTITLIEAKNQFLAKACLKNQFVYKCVY